MTTNVVNPDTVDAEVSKHNDAMQSHEALEGHQAMVDLEKDSKLPDLGEMQIFKEEQEINRINLVSQEAILVDFDTLYRKDNVRTAACLALPQMVRSLKARGFDPVYPVALSRKEDGSHLVLRGNRRTEGIEIIQRDFPDDYARILRNGQIPALVYENLSERQEALLRNDHSAQNGQVSLDGWSQFLQIMQLMKNGVNSQAEVAAKVGEFKEENGELVPNRPKVQQRCSLARLPQFIIDEYEILFRQKDPHFIKDRGDISTPVRMGKISGLWTAHLEDQKNGHFNNTEGGPLLQAKWADVKAPKAPRQQNQGNEAPSPATIKEWASKVTDDIISETLTKATGQDTARNWGDLDAEMTKLRLAFKTLEDIQLHLGGKEFRKLVKLSAKTAKETASVAS